MSYNPQNPNGQATAANSAPVVVASNQTEIPINITQVAGASVTTGSGTASGAQRVEIANNGTGTIASITTSIVPGTGATNLGKAEDVGHNTGDTGVYSLGTRQDSPTATAGSTGDYQGAAYTAQGAEWVTVTPSTTGGWDKWSTPNNNSNAALVATAGGVQVKGSAGTFGGYYCFNPNSVVTYLQVFDTSSTVTLGTTRPHLVFGIPANSAANIEFTNGINMANAIKIAATTTASGSTAPGTGMDVTILYK